jgi:uncharacterized iron-regulated membrane protein
MDTKTVAKRTRWYRKIHRYIAVAAFFFLLMISVTGLLLIWKKNSGGYLLADSQKGSSTDLSQWLSFDSLCTIAVTTLHESISPDLSSTINRIDARPDKGMVKFVFEEHYWAIQLDCATGKVLHIERRRADFIENLHDGSFFDKFTGGFFKISYGTFVGLSLLLLTITGFFLWINPRRIRNKKKPRL